MSPRVPIRLLTGVLLIAALANLAASATNGQPLLTVLSALTASGLVALWFYLSLSAATTSAADHSTDSRPQSPSAGVKAGLTPGQPARRLHDIASAVKTVAGMGIVVGSIIALRTIIALEALHVEALQ
jgi:hypothetical protein